MSSTVALAFFNRKLAKQHTAKGISFILIQKFKIKSRANFKTLAKLMIALESNVLLEETWN